MSATPLFEPASETADVSVAPCEPRCPEADAAEPASAAGNEFLRRQQSVVAIGRRALARPEHAVLLHDAATMLGEMLEGDGSGFAQRQADGQLSFRGSFRGPEGACTAVDCRLPREPAASLAGFVLQSARPVLVADAAAEERFSDGLMRNHGMTSALAVPLALSDGSFGMLAVFARRSEAFDPPDRLFAETVAHLVSSSIGQRRAEEALQSQRRLTERMLDTVEALVLELQPDGRIARLNAAAEALSGFSSAEVAGRPIAAVFPITEQAAWFARTIESLRNGEGPIRAENILQTKHGRRRRVAWTCDACRGPDGAIETVVATGVDVTAQREAEQRIEQVLLEQEQAMAAPAASAEATPAGSARAASAAAADAAPNGVERRAKARRLYQYRQWVAPVLDGKAPAAASFVAVDCHDISPGGLSFLWPSPPPTDTFVIGLGRPPRLMYLAAQVCHIQRVEVRGQRFYLVGCSYVGRAELPPIR